MVLRKTAVKSLCRGGFPVKIRGLFRPHYMTWSDRQMIEFHALEHLRNVVRIITHGNEEGSGGPGNATV